MADDSTTSVMSGGELDDRPPSDWDEQDLLTIDEASERLVEELAQLREQIAQEQDATVRGRLERRAGQLDAALTSIQGGPTDLARV